MDKSNMKIDELSPTTTNSNRMSYNGKEIDKDLNCYHYGARFYDPAVGRWWVVDAADEFNTPYGYVGNNPIHFIDPDGNCVKCFLGGDHKKAPGKAVRKYHTIINQMEDAITNLFLPNRIVREKQEMQRIATNNIPYAFKRVHTAFYISFAYSKTTSLAESFTGGFYTQYQYVFGSVNNSFITIGSDYSASTGIIPFSISFGAYLSYEEITENAILGDSYGASVGFGNPLIGAGIEYSTNFNDLIGIGLIISSGTWGSFNYSETFNAYGTQDKVEQNYNLIQTTPIDNLRTY